MRACCILAKGFFQDILVLCSTYTWLKWRIHYYRGLYFVWKVIIFKVEATNKPSGICASPCAVYHLHSVLLSFSEVLGCENQYRGFSSYSTCVLFKGLRSPKTTFYLFFLIYLFESRLADFMLITDGAKLKFAAQCMMAPTSMSWENCYFLFFFRVMT